PVRYWWRSTWSATDARPPADDEPAAATVRSTLAATARRAIIHLVVLPVLLGLAYNATGRSIPGPVDEVLTILGQAVMPVSLITIGLTLAKHPITGAVLHTIAQSLGKLVIQPAIVFLAAYYGLGVRGLPLTVAVMFAAL